MKKLDVTQMENLQGGLVPDWVKCGAGVLGGAIIGALGGAGVGSVIPGFGTVAGAWWGGIGGALSGVGAAC